MLRTTFTTILFSLLFGGLCLRCTEDFFVDLEPLERELIGVWVATERQDSSSLAAFNGGAQLIWQRNYRKYAGMTLSQEEKVALRLTEVWMNGLDAAVRQGNFRQIDLQLAQLHTTLRELREPYADRHPADLLYEFDDRWNWVEEISHDQMMCLVEWSEFEDAFRFALTSWEGFRSQASRRGGVLFPGIGRAAPAAERTALAVDEELEHFRELLTRGDHTLTTASSEAVRLRFLEYVAVLIDYPKPDINL
ncbi:hypothetical protein [Lewinella sp. IMCC34191]|uniref:hypothetical protein n=1 Tax=Lewinella sp. IMCC34191 TaxID=2259172 RepID=UPI000E24ACF3|nr:hypothetical protein [Lewinella sp. IMCC34191]